MDLALIDFDPTVTTCDSYARFLRRVASPQQLAAAKWSVGPWLAGYRLGLVSAAALRIRVTRLTCAASGPSSALSCRAWLKPKISHQTASATVNTTHIGCSAK